MWPGPRWAKGLEPAPSRARTILLSTRELQQLHPAPDKTDPGFSAGSGPKGELAQSGP